MSTFFVICLITKSSLFSDRCCEDNVGNRTQTISTITGEESVFCLPTFFPLQVFFRLLYIHFLCCKYCFEIWNQAETRWPLVIPPYQQQFHLPPSPPTPVITPSATPVLPLFPAWCLCFITILFIVCDKGNTFPFYSGAFSPISWGYFYLHMSRGRSLFVNFKKSLTRTFAVFIIIGLPYDFDFSSIL